MNGTTQSGSGSAPRKRGRGLLLAFLAVLIAFGAGYGWQWYEGRSIREQLDRTETELRIERLRVGLAQAAVSAQSGDFEAARRQMSQFFTRLQNEAPNLPPDLAAFATGILARRDDVITGLSRSNAQYVGVLQSMLDRFQTAAPSTPPAAAAPTQPAITPGAGEETGPPATEPPPSATESTPVPPPTTVPPTGDTGAGIR